ncbi:uncharacterized protein LOC112344411 isoform X2 [Selaginella moellendorffii]|uniref:uncharacterized protein LOC112343427 isoform X2 n=1 Tax=Selaginella moellendorffii TaxID=88036 RepID=UPI000D1C2A34|nr:uncharacterized protein LOC112343427 isoform X2 [Selaginella moellendorffii]XP_024524860.1 uncharacterized protein LOC112344411 isoform X2 [Selaginella moellendorffii]|eukprot:XP_024522625.1 uncharacterized protein LOC112343427 isoform X2 [Selaginella moellendorffii]
MPHVLQQKATEASDWVMAVAMAPCNTCSTPVVKGCIDTASQRLNSSLPGALKKSGCNVSAKCKQFERAKKSKKHTEFRLHSFSLIGLFTLATTRPVEEVFNTWVMSEQEIKNMYMFIAILFSFGCCVAGSMIDPYYDGDDYRRAGGDGSVHWQYDKTEREEIEAREELWEEELQRELEEKSRLLKQVEEKEKERV